MNYLLPSSIGVFVLYLIIRAFIKFNKEMIKPSEEEIKKREEIKKEIRAIEDKAFKEARKKYPVTSDELFEENFVKQEKYRGEIISEYLIELSKKYYLSKKELSNLRLEYFKEEFANNSKKLSEEDKEDIKKSVVEIKK